MSEASTTLDLVCHECNYDLRAHADDEACPECGTPVATSMMAMRLGDRFTLEGKLLAKEHLYIRNRAGSVFLGGMMTIAFITFVFVSTLLSTAMLTSIFLVTAGGAIFYFALAWGFNSKINHCRSIRQYRELLTGADGRDRNEPEPSGDTKGPAG